MFTHPPLGHGVGLRPRHSSHFLASTADVAWVEAISENFMGVGGRPWAVLEQARRDRPVVLHGVSLAIGSTAPLDLAYVATLKRLIDRVQPALVSDHLSWGREHGNFAHDLWPMPYTRESLEHVISRVVQVQDLLGRQVMLENPSTYLQFRHSDISEAEFLAEVARRADCGILLDVNNVYVSARNHGFDAHAYLDAIPAERVGQIHLAGHQDRGEIVIDTHEGPVPDPVWALYADTVARLGAVPTLIEWDEAVPEWEVLLAESHRAAEVERTALAARAQTQEAA